MRRDSGAWPLVPASLQVVPAWSNCSSLGAGTAAPLTAVRPLSPTMTWVGHVTQVSSLVSELRASVARLENKRISLCTVQRSF